MFTKEDILTKLQNGETVDVIANEMTKVLNEANAAYKELVKEEERKKKIEEARKKEEEHRNQVKLSELQDIVDCLTDWLYDWHGIEPEEAKAEEIIEIVDFMIKYFKNLKDLTNIILPKANPRKALEKNVLEPTDSVSKTDKAIQDFLDKMMW